jgi:hypothetical protein
MQMPQLRQDLVRARKRLASRGTRNDRCQTVIFATLALVATLLILL